jgi:hypothetical protein
MLRVAFRSEIVGVGLPLVVVELASRQSARLSKPNATAFANLLPKDGAYAVHAYTRDVPSEERPVNFKLGATLALVD